MALEHETARAAADALAVLDGRQYRTFNVVLADRRDTWFVRNNEHGIVEAVALPPGLHMVTAHDPDDMASPRVARHLARFRAAAIPAPPDWQSWPDLLADTEGPREAALSVPDVSGFGTVCASLLGLPAEGAPIWLFAAGPAGQAPFEPIPTRTGGEGG